MLILTTNKLFCCLQIIAFTTACPKIMNVKLYIRAYVNPPDSQQTVSLAFSLASTCNRPLNDAKVKVRMQSKADHDYFCLMIYSEGTCYSSQACMCHKESPIKLVFNVTKTVDRNGEPWAITAEFENQERLVETVDIEEPTFDTTVSATPDRPDAVFTLTTLSSSSTTGASPNEQETFLTPANVGIVAMAVSLFLTIVISTTCVIFFKRRAGAVSEGGLPPVPQSHQFRADPEVVVALMLRHFQQPNALQHLHGAEDRQSTDSRVDHTYQEIPEIVPSRCAPRAESTYYLSVPADNWSVAVSSSSEYSPRSSDHEPDSLPDDYLNPTTSQTERVCNPSSNQWSSPLPDDYLNPAAL